MKVSDLFEVKTRAFSKYVYHSSYLPNLKKGLISIKNKGLLPSKDGYSGPGVYFAYDIEGTYDHVSKEEATTFRVRWDDLVRLFGIYPEDRGGIQRTDDEIIVNHMVPANLLEVEYFDNEWWDLDSAIDAEVYNYD